MRASLRASVVPLTATRTGKVFLPPPSAATCSSVSTNAPAGPRCSRVAASRRISTMRHTVATGVSTCVPGQDMPRVGLSAAIRRCGSPALGWPRRSRTGDPRQAQQLPGALGDDLRSLGLDEVSGVDALEAPAGQVFGVAALVIADAFVLSLPPFGRAGRGQHDRRTSRRRGWLLPERRDGDGDRTPLFTALRDTGRHEVLGEHGLV